MTDRSPSLPSQADKSDIETPRLVVAIGGSAGGSEAMQELFRGLRSSIGAVFLVAQHHDAANHGVFLKLLQSATDMRVRSAEDRMQLQANTVVVAPPRCFLDLAGTELRVVSAETGPPSTLPIDRCFQAVAREFRSRGVGIVLSGTGSDGTLGLKAVSDAGGMTLVQSLESARFSTMPQSAMTMVVVDHVLDPEAMARELTAYARHWSQVHAQVDGQTRGREIEQAIPAVADILRRDVTHNFQHYKTSTMVRRIRRRMQVLKTDGVHEYLDRLRLQSEERQALFRELLIGITSFFRDGDAFETLASMVLKPLFSTQMPLDQTIRLWVPGCSTGEEAYSLAILCREFLDQMDAPPMVQIFATDIDDRALEVARRGIYPSGIAERISPQRLERYFVKRGSRYQVSQGIRELLLFSTHNLISDPPFSRQDVVSCRNLLIYLGPHLQKKLMALFHYALRPGGYLFLGPSENISSHRELFRTIDAKHRISQRRATAVQEDVGFPEPPSRFGARRFARAPDARVDLQQVMQRIVLDEFAPKSVVVDEEGQILCASGDMQPFLSVTSGTFQNHVVKLCRSGLRVGVRAALQEARASRRRVVNDKITLRDGDLLMRIRVTVQPMPQLGEATELLLIVFEMMERLHGTSRPENADLDAEAMIGQLENELETTRLDLERSVQDLESLNEELKSSNEELLSMNEELQSANEELETSKEEVQAGNAALERAKSDLENLLRSTQIATLFLDDGLRVKRFTPAATEIYNLIESDVGRPIWHLTHLARSMPPYPDPKNSQELQQQAVVAVEAESGKWFIRSVKPYVNRDGDHEGIVVTFVDITEQKRQQKRIHEYSERIELAMRAGNMGAWDWDLAEDEIQLDETVAAFYGHDAPGSWPLDELLERVLPDDREGLRRAIQQTLDSGADYAHEFRIVGPNRQVRWLAGRGRLLLDPSGKADRFLGVNFDITQAKQQEEALRDSEQQLLLLANSLPVLVGYVDRHQRYRFINDAYVREWNRSREEIVGKHVADIIGSDAYAQARPHLEAALAGQRQNFELVFRSEQTKKLKSNDVTYVPRFDAHGKVLGFYVLVIDMTAVRESVEAVRQSEQFLRKTLDTLFAFVGICTPEGILIEANRTALQAANIRPEDVLGRHFADTYWWSYSPEIQQQLREAIDRAARGHASRYDVPVRVARERLITIDFQLVPMLDQDGRVTHLVPSAIDVTDQRAAVQQLRDSEERLRLASEAAGFGTYDIDLTTREVVWSKGTRIILGYAIDAPTPVGLPYLPEVIHPDDRDQVQRAMEDATAPGGSGELDIEHRIIRADDQTVRWVRVQGRTIFSRKAAKRTPRRAVGTMIDVTERKQAELALRLRDRAIAAARNGILMLDARLPDFPIIYVNRGFSRITEWDVEEVLGQSLTLLRGPKTDGPAMRRVADALQHRAECREELQLATKLGKPIWCELNVTPVQDESTGVSHFVAVLNDISEQKRTEEQLRFARQEAESANRSKSDFLANMSHEIRTPMTAILGYTDLLAKHLSDGDDLLSVQTIRRNGQFLLEIINDILDVSKIEAGKLEIHRERFHVAELVGEVHALMEVRAREKSLPLIVEFETEVPETIYSDQKRVRQVLINLMGNAIKFTQEGEIRLTIRCDRSGQEPYLRFDVTDTGIGISSDLQERLFEPFAQADTSAARRFEGTGLGLTISRRLTEMLGGEIGVESEPGKGSKFFFTVATGRLSGVAMQQPHHRPPRTAAHEDAPIQGVAGRILVADDRREVRYLAQHFIEEAGGEVTTAENGREAVDATREALAQGTPFSVILMDMQMPVLDGYHAVQELRSQGIHTPVIALTAHAMQGDRERCLAVGCNEYLTKPIDRDELLRVLMTCQTTRQQATAVSTEDGQELVSLRREEAADSAERTGAGYEADGTAAVADPTAIAGQATKVLLIDDRPDACTALRRLLELEGFLVSVAHTADEGFRVACEWIPNAVLLDMGLPDEHGCSLAVRLRQEERLRPAVLIALTGRAESEMRDAAMSAGCDHYLLKPVSLDELLAALPRNASDKEGNV